MADKGIDQTTFELVPKNEEVSGKLEGLDVKVNEKLEDSNDGTSDRRLAVIPEVEIGYNVESSTELSDSEFFCPRKRKYSTGSSSSKKATDESSYWKVTRKVRDVKSSDSTVIGTKRKLIFHTDHAPVGEKNEWIIHEYCMNDQSMYYIEPISTFRFESKEEVEHFIETEFKQPAPNSNPTIDELKSAKWAYDPMNIPDQVTWSLTNAMTNEWVAKIGAITIDPQSVQNWMDHFNGKK